MRRRSSALAEPEVVEDPVFLRLCDKYNRQHNQQMVGKMSKLEKDLSRQAERFSQLPPGVELLTDETIILFNRLEALCTEHKLTQGVSLIHKLRDATNNELRRSLRYLEEGYTSAFTGLIKAAEYRQMAATQLPADFAHGKALSPVAVSSSPTHKAFPGTTTVEVPSCDFPSDWNQLKRHLVAEEMAHQAQNSVKNLPRKLTIRESLSSITGLLAESLATLLLCEVVRIYLYDEHQNLHCCACFPFHATRADPMHGTYTEIMLAKQIHTMVCTKYIAINGSEPQYNMLSGRDVELIQEEVKESGWGSMHSCLIFPIVSHEGANRSVGMIHAVNKVSVTRSQPGHFSSDDEVMMSVTARVLGCILTRYPVNYFTLRVGEAFRKVVHPHEENSLNSHLPAQEPEIVEDAAETGLKALASPHPIMIFRAPISDVYQTRIHRIRKRKLGNLIQADSTLSTVEFNLTALTELWETGMKDNVVMHQQYRTLTEQLNNSKLLLRNVLDGLAATRSMTDPDESARYIKKLELFARSECTDMLAEFISNTLLLCNASPRYGRRLPASCSREELSPEGSPKLSSFAGLGNSLFLTPAETQELRRQHANLNRKVASKLHVDGPDCIPAYSTDPQSKRAQFHFIDEVIKEREHLRAAEKSTRSHSRREPSSSRAGNATTHHRNPPQRTLSRKENVTAKTDFTLKRPFQI